MLNVNLIWKIWDNKGSIFCLQSPPGLKKNLMRTYESWTAEQISKKDSIHRAHALFSFAWFHAACQERRNYIPQVSENMCWTSCKLCIFLYQSIPTNLVSVAGIT